MLTLNDLLKKSTRDDIVDSVLGIAAALGLATSSWRPGDPARTVIASIAQKMSDLTDIIPIIAGGGFLDFSSGDWLTLVAFYVYNTPRLEADAGQTPLDVTNGTAGDLGPYVAGDLRFAHNTTKKTYVNINTAPITLVAGVVTAVPIAADEVGSGSTATPGTIIDFVTALGALVTCTNANTLIGIDDELDEPLRERCRLKPASLSPNGPADAYRYWALSTPDLSTPITRVSVTKSNGAVTVIVANDAGAVAGGDVALVDDRIQANVVPNGVSATTQSANGVSIPVTVDVWIRAGANLSTAAVQALVQAALATYFKSAPIGGFVIPPSVNGYIYQDELGSVAAGVSTYIFRRTVTLPAADVLLTPTDVGTLGSVTVNVHVVP